jgi:hypothetical protein
MPKLAGDKKIAAIDNQEANHFQLVGLLVVSELNVNGLSGFRESNLWSTA